MRHWALFGLSSLALACGGATSPSVGLDTLLDTEGARAAMDAAPELMEGVEDARAGARRAEAEGDLDAAADLATEGRLLLAAATVESSRREAELRRDRMEEEILSLERAASEDEAIRVDLERRIAREVTRSLALGEADAARTRAAEDEPRRYRRHVEERRSMHRRAAAVVIRRARLGLSAGRSLGADAAAIEALSLRVGEAERTSEPAESLRLADEAELDLQRLLLRQRALTRLPAPEAARRLEEDARRAGFEVRREARGMVLSDALFFDPRSSRPVASRYERLLVLLRDYPEGAVRIEVYGPIGRQRRSLARAARLADALAGDGIPAARLAAEAVGSDAVDSRGLRLDALFVAYLHGGE